MKKIVHVIEASATGTLAMASLLANQQAKNGLNVYVIYSLRPESPKDIEFLFSQNIRKINIQMLTPIEKLKSLIRLRKIIKSISPNIIFLHSSFAGFLGRISLIGALPRTKLFYIPHCISFIRKDIGRLKVAMFTMFEWIGATKRCDYIACSASEQRIIKKHIPFRRCHLIENAIDAPSSLESSIPQNIRVIITVGQIRQQKSPELFANIAKIVKSRMPTVEFVWVGDGDEDKKNLLISSGVSVLGWQSKPSVFKELSASEIYLSTAQWEGMPVSLIEAMMSGLPIVASRCAGNIDVIDHQKNGWLYESAQEAADYIFKILDMPVLAQSIARQAQAHAIKRFSTERYLKDIESVTK